mgnify:CR=1 FL=1
MNQYMINNYELHALKPTIGNIVIVTSMGLLASIQPVPSNFVSKPLLKVSSYERHQEASTRNYSEFVDINTNLVSKLDFGKEITFFYEKLLNSQKDLDLQTENILFDNIWELYLT